MPAAVADLMDRVPETDLVEKIAQAAQSTWGVLAIEKLRVRKLGTKYSVDVHVEADPTLSLRDAHVLSGKVKARSAPRCQPSTKCSSTWSRTKTPPRPRLPPARSTPD